MQFGLSQKHIDAIYSVFSRYPAIEEAIIYGSRAKGNFRKGSDIDITLVEEELSFSEFLKIESELDDLLLPYNIDLSQKRNIDRPDLIDHINRIGKFCIAGKMKLHNSL